VVGRSFLPKFIESLILEKPDSKSPNLFLRIHLASNTSRIPNTTTAPHPSVMPAICALLSWGLSSGLSSGSSEPVLALSVGNAEVVGVVDVAAVELGSSPVGRLTVDVGVVVVVPGAVPVLVAVWIAVGTRSGPVPDAGRMRVATMVECVFGAALDTPTHIL
jgi:hypothetical protein